MQALHMTETDGIGLEFRGQFTTRYGAIKRHDTKTYSFIIMADLSSLIAWLIDLCSGRRARSH